MVDTWTALPTEAKAALCGVLAGVVLSLLQRLYTVSKLPGLNVDSTTLRKRVVSVLATVIPAALVAYETRNWQPVVTVAVVAWFSGQGTHAATKAKKSE